MLSVVNLDNILPRLKMQNFRITCWAMNRYLYKVSQPRSDLVFHPSTFWHTLDWESSTTRYRDDYIEDKVLYVGDFDEVNIHLFPRKRTVRVVQLMRTIRPLKAVEYCAYLAKRHTYSVPPQVRMKWNHLDQRFLNSAQMVLQEFEKANTFLGYLKKL